MYSFNITDCLSLHGDFTCLWLNFIYVMIISLLDNITFVHLSKLEIEKRKFILISALVGLLNFIVMFFVDAPYYRAIHFAISILTFKFGFRQTIEKSALGESFNALVSISFEVLFAEIFCIVYPEITSYMAGLSDCRYNISLKLSIIIARVILLIIFKLKKIHIIIQDHFKMKNRISILIIAFSGLIIIFFTSIELLYFIGDFPYMSFLLNVISLMFYFCITIKNVLRINLLETQDSKIHSLEIYNKTLGIMYDNIRGFKHDFFNFVIALDGYVKAENMTGVKLMSNAILTECKQLNEMNGIIDPSIVGNPALYSIITNKYYLAKEQGVKMKLEVMTNLEQYHENSYEICRILGILLDNAIEAAKETEEKIMNLRFLDDSKRNRKLIIVENSYNNKNVNLDKIFVKGYTTKGANHGLGLWNIKSILMSNEDLNLYTTKEELFKQQLEIYTKSK